MHHPKNAPPGMEWRSSLHVALVLACVALVGLFAVGCGGETVDEPAETAETDTAAGGEMPEGSATISGTVTYEGQVPNLDTLNMNADPICQEAHGEPVTAPLLVLGEGNTMANVFVKVVSGHPQQQYPVPSEPVVIDQEGCLYEPRVVGVMAGQALEFQNSDDTLHNVHGMPEQNREFNFAMPATVEESDVTLNTPEPIFPVKCDVHPWMQAYVAVMDHPYFATTGEDGSFEIADLPAGTYEIEAWHERLGTQTATVTVEDGGSGTADFTFSR